MVESQKKPPRRAQHILRYASWKDVAMYAAAFVTVMISGLNQPAQLIIFGNLLDSFNTADTAEAVRLVHFFALMYAVVGIQQLITITLQTALATRVASAVWSVIVMSCWMPTTAYMSAKKWTRRTASAVSAVLKLSSKLPKMMSCAG